MTETEFCHSEKSQEISFLSISKADIATFRVLVAPYYPSQEKVIFSQVSVCSQGVVGYLWSQVPSWSLIPCHFCGAGGGRILGGSYGIRGRHVGYIILRGKVFGSKVSRDRVSNDRVSELGIQGVGCLGHVFLGVQYLRVRVFEGVGYPVGRVYPPPTPSTSSLQ